MLLFRQLSVAVLFLDSLASAHSHHHGDVPQDVLEARIQELEQKWGTDWSFTGISTFAHLPHVRCLTNPDNEFDIGILGVPFDTTVSYRPGARFGPRAIRSGSARQVPYRSFNPRAGLNPYTSWAKIVDCGDVPVSPFDNDLALRQMSEAFLELGQRAPALTSESPSSYFQKPRLVTLGGDHSIALPALRALKQIHGRPISVVHFDAHQDTWHPAKYPSAWVEAAPVGAAHTSEMPQSYFTHGSMFWLAGTEGLVANGSSVHAGLRSRLSDYSDYDEDDTQGWTRISSDDIDDMGTAGIISAILDRVGTETPVYLSVDIDVIDPGLCPGTGTPEAGGWTTRELIRILRGLEGLNVIGADIVEVSPPFDTNAEVTAVAAAQVAFEIVTSMVRRGLMEQGRTGKRASAKDEL